MLYTQHFFIDGKYYGQATRTDEIRGESLIIPTSDLYFCGTCGDVWGRMPVLDEAGKSTPWQSYRHMCRACSKVSKYRWDWPGTVWRGLDASFNQCLPKEVLERDLLLHIDAFDKES